MTLELLVFFSFTHAWLLFSDPYMWVHFFKSPYKTSVQDGAIVAERQYDMAVRRSRLFDLIGYYKSGVLLIKHRVFTPRSIVAEHSNGIIGAIHALRFNPKNPFLISGDQFSVLYPRNLGVFYNQLLNPAIARDKNDWERRQRIYLQSVLFAIDAFSYSDQPPKTTIVPIGRRSVALTQVHPRSSASDTMYGILFAMDVMSQPIKGSRPLMTQKAIRQLLADKRADLQRMTSLYAKQVQDPVTGLVRADVHLASARDGVVRKSSFYDNVVLWKTLSLARTFGLYDISSKQLKDMRDAIDQRFWDEERGYYHNDTQDESFSADWLIGYVTGFFDLSTAGDQKRARRIVAYIDDHKLASPLPIKYQKHTESKKTPFIVKLAVSSYGTDSIWSYWGCEYITLLMNLYTCTKDICYLQQARRHIAAYEEKIDQYGGFPETFDRDGNMLKSFLYKSILRTGWVVQFEHARHLLEQAEREISQ